MTQPDLARLEVSTRDQQIEAICQARCLRPGLHWSDGMTDGVARIEQMLAERCLDALALPALLARVRELESALTVAEESLDQMLDDMGETGQCVCPAAKFEAIDALANVRRTLNPTPTEER